MGVRDSYNLWLNETYKKLFEHLHPWSNLSHVCWWLSQIPALGFTTLPLLGYITMVLTCMLQVSLFIYWEIQKPIYFNSISDDLGVNKLLRWLSVGHSTGFSFLCDFKLWPYCWSVAYQESLLFPTLNVLADRWYINIQYEHNLGMDGWIMQQHSTITTIFCWHSLYRCYCAMMLPCLVTLLITQLDIQLHQFQFPPLCILQTWWHDTYSSGLSFCLSLHILWENCWILSVYIKLCGLVVIYDLLQLWISLWMPLIRFSPCYWPLNLQWFFASINLLLFFLIMFIHQVW